MWHLTAKASSISAYSILNIPLFNSSSYYHLQPERRRSFTYVNFSRILLNQVFKLFQYFLKKYIAFRWGLWNIGISCRHPSLQLLLSKFSRRGWRTFGQRSLPIGWTLNYPIPSPPAHHPLTAPISVCYPTPCFVYVVASGTLWPTFYH